MTDWIAVLRAVAVRLGYGPAETRIPIILAIAAGGAATELERQRDAAQGADPLHPDGRCTCGGGGSCEWCRSHCVDCGVRLTAQGAMRESASDIWPASSPETPRPHASSERHEIAMLLWDHVAVKPGRYGWLNAADAVLAREAGWRKEIDALRAQLAEREAELAALRSSERERLIAEVVAKSSALLGGFFPYPLVEAARELAANERARRARETT